jgi:hypothetical protein
VSCVLKEGGANLACEIEMAGLVKSRSVAGKVGRDAESRRRGPSDTRETRVEPLLGGLTKPASPGPHSPQNIHTQS